MNKKLLSAFFIVSVIVVSILNSCKKEEDSLPLEPISIALPDTAITRLFPGDSLPIKIQFTTDRPINWVLGKYDIDSVDIAYTATYPDTLFSVKLDTIDPRVNLYEWSGVYFVPDTLDPYDVVRFRVSFEAGKSTFTTGQNYPAGIVSAAKEFRIDVR